MALSKGHCWLPNMNVYGLTNLVQNEVVFLAYNFL